MAEGLGNSGCVVTNLGLEVAVDAEFVSTIWPSNNSVPTAITSQRIACSIS